jgi:YbgC/YbaW family acyl-CoA thioester hydrolase
MIVLPIKSYFYDYDLGQVISNITFVRWLEHGRCYLLDNSPWPVTRLFENKMSPIVMETRIEYKRVMRLGMDVQLKMWLGGLRRSGWTLEYEFIEVGNDAPIVRATQSGCFVNLDTIRPIPIPAELQDYFREVLQP